MIEGTLSLSKQGRRVFSYFKNLHGIAGRKSGKNFSDGSISLTKQTERI